MAKGLLEEGLIEAAIARDSSVFDDMLVVAMGMMGGEPKLGRLRLTCIGGAMGSGGGAGIGKAGVKVGLFRCWVVFIFSLEVTGKGIISPFNFFFPS